MYLQYLNDSHCYNSIGVSYLSIYTCTTENTLKFNLKAFKSQNFPVGHAPRPLVLACFAYEIQLQLMILKHLVT